MAITFRSDGGMTVGGASPLVLNTPTSVADGDEMFMVVSTHGYGGTITTPTGWTILGAVANNVGLYKRTASSEPTTYSVTVSASPVVVFGLIWGYSAGITTSYFNNSGGSIMNLTTTQIDGTSRPWGKLWHASGATIYESGFQAVHYGLYYLTTGGAAKTVSFSGGWTKRAQHDEVAGAADGFTRSIGVADIEFPRRQGGPMSSYAYLSGTTASLNARSGGSYRTTGNNEPAPVASGEAWQNTG